MGSFHKHIVNAIPAQKLTASFCYITGMFTTLKYLTSSMLTLCDLIDLSN